MDGRILWIAVGRSGCPFLSGELPAKGCPRVERGVPARALWYAYSRLPGKGKPRGIGHPTAASLSLAGASRTRLVGTLPGGDYFKSRPLSPSLVQSRL